MTNYRVNDDYRQAIRPHYNPSATPGYKIMSARFESRCCDCGERIAAGEQIRFFFDTRRAAHADAATCDYNRREAEAINAMKAAAAPDAEVAAEAAEPVIADGYYTINFPAIGQHRTLRVNTGKPGHFGEGEQMIAYLSGSDNTGSYTKIGFVKGATLQVWKKFQREDGDSLAVKAARALVEGQTDAGEAGRAYALNSGRCYKCGRLLTHPESVESGIGPECAKRA